MKPTVVAPFVEPSTFESPATSFARSFLRPSCWNTTWPASRSIRIRRASTSIAFWISSKR